MQLLTLVKANVSENKFPMVDQGRQTRHNDGLKIKLPIPRNQHVKNTPYYRRCAIWNNLPLNVPKMDLDNLKKEIETLIRNYRVNLNIFILYVLISSHFI